MSEVHTNQLNVHELSMLVIQYMLISLHIMYFERQSSFTTNQYQTRTYVIQRYQSLNNSSVFKETAQITKNLFCGSNTFLNTSLLCHCLSLDYEPACPAYTKEHLVK